jgi:membrane-associated PAP2 superfamily phosphatase
VRPARSEKPLARQGQKVYSVVFSRTMKFDKIILICGIVLVLVLALKSLKQFVMLSFTLLSLKVVWLVLIVLFILMSVKKQSRSSHDTKK